MLVEQRSQAWFDLRKGKITSSEIHKIMSEGRGKESLGETGKTYLLEKVSESLGGFTQGASGAALEWGVELEDLAVEMYEKRLNYKVEKASFISFSEFYGGSPDGLVKPDGIIEVKCPYTSTNHFKHGLIKTPEAFKKVANNYYYQCISNMICADAQWCDFVSFDPRLDEQYSLFVYRLHRNEDEVKNVLARVEIATNYMKELKERLSEASKQANTAQDGV